MKRVILRSIVLTGLILAVAMNLFAQSGEELREEFHQSFPLAADGTVYLENYSGTVRILVWDRNEVKVDALKRAVSRERFVEAEVKVDVNPEEVRIRTKYPETFCTCNNPASVDYTITVPRKAGLSGVNVINGSLDIEGVRGDIRVSSINGNVKAWGMAGSAKINTVNGQLEAAFDRINESKHISLDSINGTIVLTIPSDSSASIKASSRSGEISNDFGFDARKGEHSGHDLEGSLGKGSTQIRLNNIKGRINILRAKK
jgi:DUF4097 and DUF4098 domain-containing protein YvlB